MSRFRTARDKGLAYLQAGFRDDGGFGDPAVGVRDYYKALLALPSGGYTHAANRVCDWVRYNGMLRNGDFGPRPPGGEGYSYIYPNLWVIIAAQRLGQFDLARQGMEYIRSLRDEVNGAVHSHAQDGSLDEKQDVLLVSFSGLAALYVGDLTMARDAGQWLRVVMEAQLNYPAQLYTSYTPSSGLITTSDPSEEIRYLVNADAKRDQLFFLPGAAAGFLALLYQSTGDRGWLDLAHEYMRLPEIASDHLFRLLRAGKVGWAASVLFTITGQTRYREMATRVGNNLITLQQADGSWKGAFGRMTLNESTAERVVWLDEIHQAIGG